MNQSLGDRIKSYEAAQTSPRFLPMVPVVARLDGKNFSKFTKGLQKPFDEGFSELMVRVTKALVAETHAVVGYTQSDEISLIYLNEAPKSEIWMAGRVFKMTSLLASLATSYFNADIPKLVSSKTGVLAMFDCRVFQVPNKQEAINTLIWREADGVRNSISMLAQSQFSHKCLQGKNTAQMQDMLKLEKNINWNDMPAAFKRGTYVQRRTTVSAMTDMFRASLPVHIRDSAPAEICRSSVVSLDLPPLTRIVNLVDVIFSGAEVEEPIPFG